MQYKLICITLRKKKKNAETRFSVKSIRNIEYYIFCTVTTVTGGRENKITHLFGLSADKKINHDALYNRENKKYE